MNKSLKLAVILFLASTQIKCSEGYLPTSSSIRPSTAGAETGVNLYPRAGEFQQDPRWIISGRLVSTLPSGNLRRFKESKDRYKCLNYKGKNPS